MSWKEFVLKIPSYRSSSVIEQLCTALEKVQETLEELTASYAEVGNESGKNEAIEGSETIEKEIQRVIEARQTVIKTRARKTECCAEIILTTKYGGARRLLLAYMDQLEQILLIRSNDIHALDKVGRHCVNHGRQARGGRKRRRAWGLNSS